MTQLERDLERLFAADARARSVRTVVVTPRRRTAPFASLAFVGVAAALALAAIAVLPSLGGPSERVQIWRMHMFKLITIPFAGLLVLACSPQVASNPTPTSTVTPAATTTPAATSTATTAATPTSVIGAGACQNRYQTGDTPIVAPRKAGQHLEVALDAVRPGVNGGNRWFVRFFVPTGAPGTAEIPLRATVTGPSGPLQMGAYVAGPPNAGFGPLTQPVTLHPCASAPQGTSSLVLVGAESGPVRSGTYTLTWSDIRLPEGGMRTETWTVTLTCELDPGPARPQATLCK